MSRLNRMNFTLVFVTLAMTPMASLAQPKVSCRGEKPVDAFVGQLGDYKYKEGLENHEEKAVLNRRKVKPEKGCVFSGLGPKDYLITYYKKPKSFREHVIKAQCVNAANPEEQIDGIDLGLSPATGNEVLLSCGSKEKYECADKGVGALNQEFDDRLEKKGQMAFEFSFPDGTAMGEKAWDALKGKKVFCQYWDEETKKVFVAVEWNVPAK